MTKWLLRAHFVNRGNSLLTREDRQSIKFSNSPLCLTSAILTTQYKICRRMKADRSIRLLRRNFFQTSIFPLCLPSLKYSDKSNQWFPPVSFVIWWRSIFIVFFSYIHGSVWLNVTVWFYVWKNPLKKSIWLKSKEKYNMTGETTSRYMGSNQTHSSN